MKKSNKETKFYCFSPPVMLATLLIEFSLAVYSIWKYKMTKVSRLGVAVLLALGTFQLAEYMTCGGLGLKHIDWARFGYISITLLPALGIHMVTAIAGKEKKWLVNAAYATCAGFVAYFAFNVNAISGPACYANYAVFYSEHISTLMYGAYYYGWLIVGSVFAWKWGKEDPKKRLALHSMMMGYMAFILPTTFFNIINPSTIAGIPSIMCGFAVLLAITIVVKVFPNSVESYEPIRNNLEQESES